MAESAVTLYLKGIKSEARCEVVLADTGARKTFTGKELTENGLEASEHDAPASVLITYTVIDQ